MTINDFTFRPMPGGRCQAVKRRKVVVGRLRLGRLSQNEKRERVKKGKTCAQLVAYVRW